jgi:hypothetical protein
MTDLLRRLAFTYVPPEDETVDGEYEIRLDGEETAFSIQAASGAYVVNEHGYETPGDEGSFYGVYHGDFSSLIAAKHRAAELIEASLDAVPSTSKAL